MRQTSIALTDMAGALQTVGYRGHLFPIIPGETGSKFGDATDNTSMADIAAWYSGRANTGTAHPAVAV